MFDLKDLPETVVFTDRSPETAADQTSYSELTAMATTAAATEQTQTTTHPAETEPAADEAAAAPYSAEAKESETAAPSQAQPATDAVVPDAGTQGDAYEQTAADYVLNTNTKKFHLPSCGSVTQMRSTNRKDVHDNRDALLAQGYAPCKRCNP